MSENQHNLSHSAMYSPDILMITALKNKLDAIKIGIKLGKNW